MERAEYSLILVVNLGGIGDLMLSSPALRHIRHCFPEARMRLLTSPQGAEYGRSLSCFERVVTLDAGGGIFRRAAGMVTLLGLRAARFDLCVNMRTIVSAASRGRMRFLISFINAKRSAGRDTAGRGDFFDIRVAEGDGDGDGIYEREYDCAMAEALTGVPVSDREIDFSIDRGSDERVARSFAGAGIGAGDRVIGIHLGGKPSHAWPAENFFAAAGIAAERFSCKLVVTGTAQDGRRAAPLMARFPRPVLDLTGRLTLAELGAAIRRCSAYATSDTAPMHIAAVLKVPLVAVFGPGYLRRFDPRAIAPRSIVLYKKAECAPCDKVACPSGKCLTDISPVECADALAVLLSDKEAGG